MALAQLRHFALRAPLGVTRDGVLDEHRRHPRLLLLEPALAVQLICQGLDIDAAGEGGFVDRPMVATRCQRQVLPVASHFGPHQYVPGADVARAMLGPLGELGL